MIFRFLSILLKRFIESFEEVRSMVECIFSYDHFLSRLNRIIRPFTREVGDRSYSKILISEVTITFESQIRRWVKDRGAEG